MEGWLFEKALSDSNLIVEEINEHLVRYSESFR